MNVSLVNKDLTLNITPGSMPPTVHVSEYDTGRHFIVALIDEDGKPYTIPTGADVEIVGTLNNKYGFTVEPDVVTDTFITFTVTEAMTAYAGKAWCKIKLIEPGSGARPLIQTCAFILAVDRAGVEADTVIGAPGFEEQIQDAVDNYLNEHPVSVEVDPSLSIEGAAADSKATGDAIDGLAFNGEVPINGNVHNYYFGGGANYKTLTPSNNTRTAVFPLEDGKRYHVIINGNVSNIGFANVEYESTGDLSDNTAGNPTDLYIVNSQNYKYLYVFYYNSAGATVENPNVKVLAETNLVTNERLNSALVPINDWYTPVINYDGITDGKYLTDTGYIGDSSLSCVTDYVPIIAGRKYELSGVYLSSSRAVVYYDESKTRIGSSDKGSAETVIEITAPENAAFLRTNGAAGIAPVVKAIEHPINADIDAIDERVSSLEDSIYADNSIDVGDFADGYVVSYNLTPFTSTTIKHTGYIDVEGGASVVLDNYASVGAAGVVALVFDEEHNGIETVTDGVGGGTIGSKTFSLPASARYIVFNAKPGTATPAVSYTEKQYAWSEPMNILNNLESVASKNFMQLFKTATAKPICCIIDDDTLNATDMENFATVLENNGVRGTVACLTKFFETQNDLEAKLHDLERRGHQVVLHGYTQADAYRDAVAFDDANYKLAESDFVKGATDLKKSGFVNCGFWVTPFGVSQTCMQKLARKWGMKCLVTTAKTEFNGTDGKYSRWEIQRSGLNPSDTGTLTYAQLLSLADQCAAANGWLLVNTHIYNWTGGYDRINDFITHCRGKGFEFMTLGEAWEIRKPIYDWYSTF